MRCRVDGGGGVIAVEAYIPEFPSPALLGCESLYEPQPPGGPENTLSICLMRKLASSGVLKHEGGALLGSPALGKGLEPGFALPRSLQRCGEPSAAGSRSAAFTASSALSQSAWRW